MSFLPGGRNEGGLTFWQQLALVAVPALIGAAVPPIVHGLMSKNEEKEDSRDKKEDNSGSK